MTSNNTPAAPVANPGVTQWHSGTRVKWASGLFKGQEGTVAYTDLLHPQRDGVHMVWVDADNGRRRLERADNLIAA
jgi:hypothetical protein